MINKENNINLQITLSKEDAEKLNEIIKQLSTRAKPLNKSKAIAYLINSFNDAEASASATQKHNSHEAQESAGKQENRSDSKRQNETQELKQEINQLKDLIKGVLKVDAEAPTKQEIRRNKTPTSKDIEEILKANPNAEYKNGFIEFKKKEN